MGEGAVRVFGASDCARFPFAYLAQTTVVRIEALWCTCVIYARLSSEAVLTPFAINTYISWGTAYLTVRAVIVGVAFCVFDITTHRNPARDQEDSQ